MSNSGKQRIVVRGLISKIEATGCDVGLDQGRHYKTRISRGGSARVVPVSCTPSNRATAQRAAIGDVNRALAELGVPDGRIEPAGLLQMMTGFPQREALSRLANELRTISDLPQDLFGDAIELSSILAGCDGIFRGDGISRGRSELPGAGGVIGGQSVFSILSPEADPTPPKCTRTVGVYLKEGKNFKKAFTAGKGLEALLKYYEQCAGIVRLGVVVSETWNPATLWRFVLPFEYFKARGVHTVFILKSGGRMIPMALPWE